MNIDIYTREGLFVDSKNMPISGVPFLTAETECTVTLGTFANATDTAITAIPAKTSWECDINDAFGSGNTMKIRVTAVTITGGRAVITFSPLSSTELRTALGELPAKQFIFELNGFSDSTSPDWSLQFPLVIRNRIGTGSVSPTPATGYIVYPTGGTVGQVLTKTATGSEWSDASTAGQVQADWSTTDTTAKSYIKNKPAIPSLTGYATEAWVTQQGYLTEHQSLAGYQTLITSSNKLAYSLISGTPTLATVATSGSYNDLADKPSIPSLTGYATETWVTQQGYLSEHQSLTAYQTKAITDEGGYFTTDTVEAALQQIGSTLNGVQQALQEI